MRIFVIDTKIEESLFIFENKIECDIFFDDYINPQNLLIVEPIFCDGSGWNGKSSSYTFGKKEFLIYDTTSKLTNNEIEYQAILKAMESAEHNEVILSDSQLAVYQINGIYKCHNENLEKYMNDCRYLLDTKNLRIYWISRDINDAGKILEKHNR